MSDEPKKRARRWTWWTAIVLFMLYPLSIGPATLITNSLHTSSSVRAAVVTLYAPVFIVCEHSKLAADAITRYVGFWDRYVDFWDCP
jgi:membrane protein YdbS with pleckstrin-like domain